MTTYTISPYPRSEFEPSPRWVRVYFNSQLIADRRNISRDGMVVATMDSTGWLNASSSLRLRDNPKSASLSVILVARESHEVMI